MRAVVLLGAAKVVMRPAARVDEAYDDSILAGRDLHRACEAMLTVHRKCLRTNERLPSLESDAGYLHGGTR